MKKLTGIGLAMVVVLGYISAVLHQIFKTY